MFEYAASYPREAEESLAAAKSRYKSLLGIIGSHGTEAKPMIAQMGINATPTRNGYEYEITAPAELKELAKAKANQLLSKFDCTDRRWFEYLGSTEFYRTFDHAGKTAYEFPCNTIPDQRLSPQTSTATGETTGFSIYDELAEAFNCFLKVHRFL